MRRLFLAIAAKDGLETVAPQVIKKLKIHAEQKDIEVRWVPMDNYHITLVFLGNTYDEKISEIETITERIAKNFAPFNLKIADLGAFPNDFSSRVLWFGVQNSKALRSLQDSLATELKHLRYKAEEQGFSPHLTIGRLRNPHKTKDMTSPFVRKKFAKIQINEIVLYESVGSAPFQVYKPIKTFKLSGVPASIEDSDFE
ncbi:MAG TPA: RNA 2',3'-cyclic phosphodiesterase [Pseudobdellovibrionaceae bacterium]|jgi:2'-5' RNA ligase